mgnify:CR=1 FL=1
MDYIDQDYADVQAYCEALFQAEKPEVRITYLPPQKTPRWARTHTARPVGTRLGNGNYVRQGGNTNA